MPQGSAVSGRGERAECDLRFNQPAGSNNGVAISATGSAGGSVIVYNSAATAVDTLNSTGLTIAVNGPTPLTATNTGVGAGDGAATFFGEGSGTGVVGITAIGSAHNMFLSGGGGAGFMDITGNTLTPGTSCGSTFILVVSTNGHGYACGSAERPLVCGLVTGKEGIKYFGS